MTARLVINALVLLSTLTLAFECPKFLAGLCDAGCVMRHCLPVMDKCMADKDCRGNFASTLMCMADHDPHNLTLQTACMVPDNVLRDDAFNCMIEQYGCIKIPPPTTHYPKCRDSEVAGDKNMVLANIAKLGIWYKVHSWKLGEPVECMDCQHATFSVPEPDLLVFNSTWWEESYNGSLSRMNVVAHMTVDTPRGPGKLYNTGTMFGLTYWEPYTIVHDGSLEADPFVFFYVCGGTLQGNYTTAFAIAKTPVVTPALQTRLSEVVASLGMREEDFCMVNNTCFENGGNPNY